MTRGLAAQNAMPRQAVDEHKKRGDLSITALIFADWLLTVIHFAVVSINMFAWIFPRTRTLHRVTIACTTLSWFLLGWFYGLGYCFLTDWHWQVKRALGEGPLPTSFIHHLLNDSWGLGVPAAIIDVAIAVVFFAALGIALFQLWLERRHGQTTQKI
jgi:hypothetical protein